MLKKMTKLVFAMVALVCMGGGILVSCSNSSDSVKPGSGGNTGIGGNTGGGGSTGGGEEVNDERKISYQYEHKDLELLLTFYDDGTFEFKNDKGYVSQGNYTKSGNTINGTLTSGYYKDWDFEVDTSSGTVKMNGVTIPGFEKLTTPINPNEPEPDIDHPDYLILKGTTVTGYIKDKLPENGAIEIPEGVTSIGKSAFEDCKSIKSVNIPSSVTTIGSDAFYGCSELTGAITIPAGVTVISSQTFFNCKLTKITISDGVAEIGKSAFYGCNFTEVTIPASVTKISAEAFMGCSNLKSVTFEDTNGWYNFAGSRFGEDIESEKIDVSDPEDNAAELEDFRSSWCSLGIYKDDSKYKDDPKPITPKYLILKGTTVTGHIEEKLPANGAIEIPEGVTSIGEQAFRYCLNITSVKIADGVEVIGEGAFELCKSLESVNIPSSVTTISDRAFGQCSNLESVNIPDGVKVIGEGAFEYCYSLKSVNIPSSVTTIGKEAFKYCSNLTDIAIPKGITEISDYAFHNCKLTEITIPDGVTKIGENAFSACPLTEVNIPSSVTTIGKEAFFNCNLTEITIPDGVTKIGEYAFYGCYGLLSVTFENTEGWYDVDGQEINVKDSAQNAMNLISSSWTSSGIYKKTN